MYLFYQPCLLCFKLCDVFKYGSDIFLRTLRHGQTARRIFSLQDWICRGLVIQFVTRIFRFHTEYHYRCSGIIRVCSVIVRVHPVHRQSGMVATFSSADMQRQQLTIRPTTDIDFYNVHADISFCQLVSWHMCPHFITAGLHSYAAYVHMCIPNVMGSS